MIAVDTNVLLRYLLRDDKGQAERSLQVFERAERILITDVVLVETLWTLSGSRYGAAKADLIAVVDNLLQEPNIRFEDDEVIWNSLQAYRGTDVDFADTLIVHKALKIASTSNGLDAIYTFDSAALQLPKTTEPV